MRKIIAITQVSLDGIMQAPGGPKEDPSGGFTRGGWAMPFFDEALEKALGETMAGEFDLLLGRRTYEIFAAYWPYAGDNPIAKAFTKATKFVVTRTLDQFDWVNSQPIGGDAVDEIRRLKASAGPELHIWGSSELLQTLIAAELVDEFRIWVFPLVLGKGKRLFENGVPPRSFTLAESRSAPNGVLFNTYRPAGPLPRSPETENPSAAELARRRKLAAEEKINPEMIMSMYSILPDGKLAITASESSSKHDFDFLVGGWKIRNRKLKEPLTGRDEWDEFDATQNCRSILQGFGDFDIFSTEFDGKPFEGFTLRLFDPKTRLWTIYWADSKAVKLDGGKVGSFDGDIGEFFSREVFAGKNIIVKFHWDKRNPEAPVWSAAFSGDEGRTWEWNWHAYFARR